VDLNRPRGPAPPQAWCPSRSLVAPEWQWAWEELRLAVPFWHASRYLVQDVSSYGIRSISYQGTPTNGVGKYGRHLTFGLAAVDKCIFGDRSHLKIAGPITVAALVRLTTASHPGTPIVARWGTDQNYVLQADPTLGFYIRVAEVNRSASSTSSYNDNLWHWLVGQWNGANVIVDVDGGSERVVGAATSGPIDTPSVPLAIGNYSDNSTASMGGDIALAYIWARALSALEIRKLAADPFGPLRPARRVVVRAPMAGATIAAPFGRSRLTPPWSRPGRRFGFYE